MRPEDAAIREQRRREIESLLDVGGPTCLLATLVDTSASQVVVGLTASVAELNTLHDSGITAAEAASIAGQPAGASMVSTPASGTCAVQLTVLNGAGTHITHAVSGIGYLSTSNGLAAAAATGVAKLTNGEVTEIVTGSIFHFVTTAGGLVGLTVTAAAGSYYVTLQMPNGKLVTTTAIVVN
jgi:hypothetical protein